MPLGTELGFGPGDIVLDENPAPSERGTAAPMTFLPMSIVAKRSLISATAEHLFTPIITPPNARIASQKTRKLVAVVRLCYT